MPATKTKTPEKPPKIDNESSICQINRNFSQNLRLVLSRTKSGNRMLAERTGLGQSHISMLAAREDSENKRNPTFATACIIADAIGISVDTMRSDPTSFRARRGISLES